MLYTLHSMDLLGPTELHITCDCLHQHSKTQYARIEHPNKQLLFHQCLQLLWLTKHTQVPCMLEAFNMRKASEETNEVDSECYR